MDYLHNIKIIEIIGNKYMIDINKMYIPVYNVPFD